jgi:glycosyltransferase involved in cell wall biosynthesis
LIESGRPTMGPEKRVAAPSDDRLSGIRVLVLTSGHEALDGRVYAREAQSLHRMGADVTVVAKLTRGTPAGARVVPIAAPSSRLARFLVQPWRCLWAARHFRPDIVHFHDPEMLATLPLAKLWWPCSKFVYDVHEDFATLMLIREWFPKPFRPMVRALTDSVEKGLARLADGIVGVTPPLAEKFGHRHKTVVYNFVPEDFLVCASRAARRPRDREFDLLHLGTLSTRRALFLAEVLKTFHRLRPGARTMVVGASAAIENLLRDRIPTGCVLAGKAPYNEIPPLVGNARVGLDVHPWPDRHLEVALPVKVCEYMAAGCAVVASSMPVLDSLLRESGADGESLSLIRGGEPEEYARAAVRLIEAIDRGADPGGKLRVLAQHYMNFDSEAEKLAGLYLALIEKPCVA